MNDAEISNTSPKASSVTGLPKMSGNMSKRRNSPYYQPAPWGDRELGQVLDTGRSPLREKRMARKNNSERN
jgi:hypothetical protein